MYYEVIIMARLLHKTNVVNKLEYKAWKWNNNNQILLTLSIMESVYCDLRNLSC